MEIRQLKYFIAAADALNFSRAAESLYITQPTLSQQIAELERELELDLFVRTKRSVLLTPAGAELLIRSKDLLHRMEATVPAVRSLDPMLDNSGSLCICYEPPLRDDFGLCRKIAAACMRLRKEHPSIRIFFREIPFDGLDKAMQDDADICITTQSQQLMTDKAKINVFPLSESQFELFYCSYEPAELTREHLIRILSTRTVFMQEREMNGMLQVMRLFSDLGISPEIKFRDNITATTLVVASGDGCIIVPRSFRNTINFENAHFLPIDVPSNHLYTSLVWSPKNLNNCIQLFIDAINAEEHE